MREFTKIYSSLWDSERFCALPDDQARLFYIYMHANPDGNSLGCFRFKPGAAVDDLRWEPETVTRSLEHCCTPMKSPIHRAINRGGEGLNSGQMQLADKAPLLMYDPAARLVYIDGFLARTKPTNQNHMAGALTLAVKLPDSPLKALVIKELLSFSFADAPAISDKKQKAVFEMERCREMVLYYDYSEPIHRSIERAFPIQIQNIDTEPDGEGERDAGAGPDASANFGGCEPNQKDPPGQAQPADGVPDCGPDKPGTTASGEGQWPNDSAVLSASATVCNGQTQSLADGEDSMAAFERFYGLYRLARNKSEARAEWQKLWPQICSNPELYDTLLIAAQKEAETRPTGPKENPRHAHTFLRSQGWLDYEAPPAPTKVAPERIAWLQRRDYVRTNGRLPDESLSLEECPADIRTDIETLLETRR